MARKDEAQQGSMDITYNEAECEERIALDDMAGHVAAVMALADDALIAGDLLAESVLAADEEEEHDGLWSGGVFATRGSRSWSLEMQVAGCGM